MSLESINQKLAAAQQHQAGYVKNKIRTKKNAGGSRARGSKTELLTAIADLECQLQPHEQKAIETWVAMLDANTMVYDKQTREWEEQPDWRARDIGASRIIAYLHGLPIQRQIQLNANLETLAETLASVKSSPETIRALEAVGFHKRGSEKPVSDAREVGPFD